MVRTKRYLWGLVVGVCLGAVSILFCRVVLGFPPLASGVIGTIGALMAHRMYVGSRVIRARFGRDGRPGR